MNEYGSKSLFPVNASIGNSSIVEDGKDKRSDLIFVPCNLMMWKSNITVFSHTSRVIVS